MFRLLRCLLPILWLLVLCPTAPADMSLQEMAKTIYKDVRGPEEFSVFFRAMEGICAEDAPTARMCLYQAGMDGDIPALAFVLAYAQAEARGKSVPYSPDVRLLEEWFMANLGQGQGGYLLAIMHLRLLRFGLSPSDAASMELTGEYFRQAAQARHPDGLYGAVAAGGGWEEPPFAPPPAFPQPRHISPKVRPDWGPWQRYWISWAAELGQGDAAGLLAFGHEKLFNTPDEDNETVRYYYDLAAQNGDGGGAAILEWAYRDGVAHTPGKREGLRLQQNYVKSFFYGVLSARYNAKGAYITDDEGRHKDGYDTEILGRHYVKQGYMTQADYDEGLRKSLEIYNAHAARRAEEEARVKALYAKAAEHLPELQEKLLGMSKEGLWGVEKK